MSLKKILASVSCIETCAHIERKYKQERTAAAFRMSSKEATKAALSWAQFRADTFNANYAKSGVAV